MSQEQLVTSLVHAFQSTRPADIAFFGNRRNTCAAYGFDFATVELAVIRALAALYEDRSEPLPFQLHP